MTRIASRFADVDSRSPKPRVFVANWIRLTYWRFAKMERTFVSSWPKQLPRAMNSAKKVT